MSLRTSRFGIYHRIQILSRTSNTLETLLYLFFDFSPDLDDQPMLLFVRKESSEIILVHFIGFDIANLQFIFFFLGHFHIQDIDGRPC